MVDRISALSDDILLHILSFSKTRDAVKTSILSKRWQKLCYSINHLDLDFCCKSRQSESVRRISFNNFVDGVLLGENRIQSLTSFSLSYDGYPLETSDLNAWITAAIAYNPQSFDLGLFFGRNVNYYTIPQALFDCQTLVALKLSGQGNFAFQIVLNVPNTFCLSSLKQLHLRFIKLESENKEPLKNLISGCPVLEELHMKRVRGISDSKWLIHSPSLKILKIKTCEGNCLRPLEIEAPKLESLYLDDSRLPCLNNFSSSLKFLKLINSTDFTHHIEAPKLEYLYLDDYRGDQCMENFSIFSPRLVSAVIKIAPRYCCGTSPVLGVFHSLSNSVEKLELSFHRTVIQESIRSNLPEFRNLIHLKLVVCKTMDIVPFVQHSPNLKYLVTDNFPNYDLMEPSRWRLPELVPECLLLYLETVEIRLSGILEEDGDNMKMIEYLIKNGKVLKKMVITCEKFDEHVSNRLSKLPKASKGYQILLSTKPYRRS